MNEVARLFEDFDVLRERVAEAVPANAREEIDLMFESLTGNLDAVLEHWHQRNLALERELERELEDEDEVEGAPAPAQHPTAFSFYPTSRSTCSTVLGRRSWTSSFFDRGRPARGRRTRPVEDVENFGFASSTRSSRLREHATERQMGGATSSARSVWKPSYGHRAAEAERARRTSLNSATNYGSWGGTRSREHPPHAHVWKTARQNAAERLPVPPPLPHQHSTRPGSRPGVPLIGAVHATGAPGQPQHPPAPAAFQDAVAVAPVQLQLDGSKRSASASSKGVSLPLHTETESEQQQLGEKQKEDKSKIADRCRTLLNWADWQRQELSSSSSSSSTPGSNNVNIAGAAMNIRPRHEHHRDTEMQHRALYEAKLRALDAAGAAAASSPSSALRDFDQAFARIHESFAVRLQALDCALKYAENEILASTNPELITSSDVLVRKRIDKALTGAAKIAQKKYFCRAELYEKVALREELKGKMKSMEEQDAGGHRSRSRNDAIVVLTENVLSLLEEENQKQKSRGKMGGTAKQSTATCSFTWGGLPYAEVMLLEYSEQQ